MPGFNVVAEKVGLRERMASTDIVITGEERLDFQTLQGKAPYGVASLAKQLDKPVGWANTLLCLLQSVMAARADSGTVEFVHRPKVEVSPWII
jgi:glycerate kinase